MREQRDVDLFEEGLLDSMAAVELLVDIEEEFGVSIAPTGVPREEMNTVNLIDPPGGDQAVAMKQAGADSPEGKTSGDKLSGSAMLKAVGVGLALIAVAALLAETVLLPLQGARRDDTRLYDYLYSGVKSASTAFTLENMSDDGYLVFGSSEFYIGKKLVPQCPAAVFGEHVTGVDMTFVGEAYDQSLWHAIAAGAYGSKVARRKVALVVSPQWFFKGNGQQSKFKSKFSYDLYRQFCDNDSISDETKSHVRQRLAALGIDETSLAAANDDTPLDALNNVMYSFGDDLSARFKLVQAAASAPEKSHARKQGEYTGEPDWDALLRWADDSGAHACTNNDYGIYDDYWTRNSQFHVESDEETQAGGRRALRSALLSGCLRTKRPRAACHHAAHARHVVRREGRERGHARLLLRPRARHLRRCRRGVRGLLVVRVRRSISCATPCTRAGVAGCASSIPSTIS